MHMHAYAYAYAYAYGPGPMGRAHRNAFQAEGREERSHVIIAQVKVT